MTYSLGEVEALSRKATRGAGFSWGLAEDTGKAVRWLCSWGLPGADALARYLDSDMRAQAPEETSSTHWHATSGPLCPIICGTAFGDLGTTIDARELSNVAWPLLLVPHIAWVGQPAQIAWNNTCIQWDGRLHVVGEVLTPMADRVQISKLSKVTARPCAQGLRADVDTQTLAMLNTFASNTYAPETEASKLTGAGAGLKDED